MERLLVVGAGTMGRGIAHVAALAGYDVAISDKAPDQAEKALAAVRADMKKGVEKQKLAQSHMDAAVTRLRVSADLCADATRADVVIEAVFEEVALKTKLLSHLDEHMGPKALL